MSVERFRIIFDKPDKVYYSGEMVTGRVELVLNSKMKIRGVELKIKGKAISKWDEHGFPARQYYYSYEICLNSKQILIGGKEIFKLSRGEHTYPFAIRLPDKIPTSFEGRHGKISYYGKAKINIPFNFDIRERNKFTVIRPLDLDLFPNLKTSHAVERSKTFHSLWCTNGTLTVVVRLPKTGFAATESIPITMEVNNASKHPVNSINVDLKRTICWKANGCSKKKYTILRSFRSGAGGVKSGESRTWTENYELPSISFPNLDGCKIIKIKHELRIEAVTPSSGSDLHFHIPVTIVDAFVLNDSKPPTDTPSMEISPDNMADDPVIQMPATEVPLPYPDHDPPKRNNSDPENCGGAPFEKPSLPIYSPAIPDRVVLQLEMSNEPQNSSFVEPNSHLNSGEISQMPTHENSVSVQQNPPQAPSALLHSNLTTNPESAERRQK